MRIKDVNGNAGSYVDSASRGRVFSHLENAKKTLAPSHGAQAHINKAVNELGGVVTNAEDSDGGDLTSHGEIERNVDLQSQGAPQATGSAAIADKVQKSEVELKRDRTVIALYTEAAKSTDTVRKARCEALASKLADIDLTHTRQPAQRLPGGLHPRASGGKKSFGDRHSQPF